MLTDAQRAILEGLARPGSYLDPYSPTAAEAIRAALEEIDARRGGKDSPTGALLLLQRAGRSEDIEDDVAAAWSDRIYHCPECDEEHPHDHTACSRYPAQHDETGYMGTGTDCPEDIRALAKAIANLS